jgi:hypothetical protein
MDKQIFFLSITAAAIVLAPACRQATKPAAKSDTAATKKKPAIPPGPVTAQLAYYEIYKPARAWASDVLALSLASGDLPGISNDGGKAGVWTAAFVSPSRREARKFTYYAADSPEDDIHRGVSISNTLPWGGTTASSKPFSNSEFAIDSDVAYEAAEAQAAAWLKKHPQEKATFQLGNASRFPAPVWYVMWGTKKNGYAALINAVTGKPVK